MPYLPKVLGERCYLSPMDPADVATYQRWVTDPDVSRYTRAHWGIFTLPAEEAWFRERAMEAYGPSYSLAIVTRDTHRLIGNTGLFALDWINRTAEFGIMIGEADTRGQGYGTEATRLCLDFAFALLNLHSVYLMAYAYNPAGIRAYEKAGFRHGGRRRESRLIHGEAYDVICMDILAREHQVVDRRLLAK